jgi:hypothetical protein
MRRDAEGCMISETSPWPGSIGDSCANTCRSEVLNPKDENVVKAFVTELGVVRHKSAPSDWMEKDTSDDQLIPFYLAAPTYLKDSVRKWYPYKAGNGSLHNPLAYAVIWGHWIGLNVLLLLQLFTMTCVPYRWSDADGLKWYQRFERSAGSSADWLNWFVICVALKRQGHLLFKPNIDRVAHKVFDYYQNEPNNLEVLRDYEEAFKLWQ